MKSTNDTVHDPTTYNTSIHGNSETNCTDCSRSAKSEINCGSKNKTDSRLKKQTSFNVENSNFLFKSFNKKGYGNGFLSKSLRFDTALNYANQFLPSSCDYDSAKVQSISDKVKKSFFGRSLFLSGGNSPPPEKRLPFPGPTTYFKEKAPTVENLNRGVRLVFQNKNGGREFNISAGTSDFTSTTKRFTEITKEKESTPSPTSYFLDTKFKIKNPTKLSPPFMSDLPKKYDPVHSLGIDEHNKRGRNKKKALVFDSDLNSNKGKVSYGNSSIVNEAMEKYKKHREEIVKKEKILTKIDLIKYSNSQNQMFRDEQLQRIVDSNIEFFLNEDGIKPPFERAAKRWDDGSYKFNDSHFRSPGPAYYTPDTTGNKVSFNEGKEFVIVKNIPRRKKKKQ